MHKEVLVGGESPWMRLRRFLVPAWIWQFVWLRHLPRYLREIDWTTCPRSRLGALADMLYLFFKLRTVPEFYGACRLWERPRSEWPLYYGIPYAPIQRARLDRRVYPVEYQILYNDKLVGAQLCKSLDVRQPRIVAIVNPDEPWRQRITHLLASCPQGRLMLKPIYGRAGIGIALAQRVGSSVIIHTSAGEVPLADFQLRWPVFIQEVVQQHDRMARLFSGSVNTCRIGTMQTPSGEVLIVGGGVLRAGVGKSHIDNFSAGGVAVGIDTHTGRLRKLGADIFNKTYTQHPTSGVTFEGFEIPSWPSLLDAARRIQKQIPFSRVLGMDFCIDRDCQPVLIEVNGLPDFTLPEQFNGPLLADPQVLKAFAEYDLLVCKAQRNVLAPSSPAPRARPVTALEGHP